jgi:hypothetical protein
LLRTNTGVGRENKFISGEEAFQAVCKIWNGSVRVTGDCTFLEKYYSIRTEERKS